MSEWKEYRISDLGIIVTGKTPRTAISENYGGDIPFLSPSDDMESKYVPLTARCLTVKGLAEVKNCLIPENSICVSCIGSDMGKSVITDRPIVTNQQINSIVPTKFFDPDFVYYLMQSKRREIRFIGGNGTAVPILNKSAFSNLTVMAPEIDEQRRISSFLSILDKKIAVNRRICENLEAQAQALFKHWFIDFAPFKDGKFIESELGMIPEGWSVGNLFDIAEVHDYKRKPLSGMQRANMKKIYPYYGATEQMDMVDNYIFDGRYVLMGEDGSVVRENGLPYIQYVWGKIWVNNHAHVLTGKNGFTTEMLLPFLTKYNIKGLVTGAVQAKLNQANMAKISLAIPPKSILDSISGLFEVLYDKYRNCCKEMDTLSKVRDNLLPKLMSGQIKL